MESLTRRIETIFGADQKQSASLGWLHRAHDWNFVDACPLAERRGANTRVEFGKPIEHAVLSRTNLTIAIVAPLGLRFHDTVRCTLGDGLNVSAYPIGRPTARQQALIKTESGVLCASSCGRTSSGGKTATAAAPFGKQTPQTRVL